jgi:hypothetical protein
MERCEKLLTWVGLVCDEPRMVMTGEVTNMQTGRSFFYADVPGANARVTYRVFESPVRAVWLLDISDELFRLS